MANRRCDFPRAFGRYCSGCWSSQLHAVQDTGFSPADSPGCSFPPPCSSPGQTLPARVETPGSILRLTQGAQTPLPPAASGSCCSQQTCKGSRSMGLHPQQQGSDFTIGLGPIGFPALFLAVCRDTQLHRPSSPQPLHQCHLVKELPLILG